jgi:hypothetical protein
VAQQHDARMMDQQRRYVAGDTLAETKFSDAQGGGTQQPLPMSYAFPTEEANRFEFEQQLKKDEGLGAHTQWFAQPRQVDFLYNAYKLRKQKDFDEWFSKTLDLRIPGNFQWAASINPGYIQRQLEQLDRDIQLQKRNAVVSTFGVHNIDDLYFKFMQDTGQLRDNRKGDSVYVRGLFRPQARKSAWSPWTDMFARGEDIGDWSPEKSLVGSNRTNFNAAATGRPSAAQGSIRQGTL